MKILKKPDNLIFDTLNPQMMENNLEDVTEPIALHHSTSVTDWDFLSQYFESKDEIQHPIFKNFGKSYFYCISV